MKMVPMTASIVVIRTDAATKKNKRVPVPAGKAFDFTKEEVEYINRVHPGALRKPVNETTDDEDAGRPSNDSDNAGTDDKATSATAPKAKAKAKKGKGKEAPAPKEIANESDGDDDDGDDSDEDGEADEDEDI